MWMRRAFQHNTSHHQLYREEGDVKPQAVMSGSRTLTTLIGCGNALKHCVPPFFVFPGVRMRSELLEGKSFGANGTCTETGWSNSEVFKTYLEDHLLKYLPEKSLSSPVIVLYDGHNSHINLDITDWAKSQNIILFILPAHTCASATGCWLLWTVRAHLQQWVPQINARQLWSKHHQVQHLLSRLLSLLESTDSRKSPIIIPQSWNRFSQSWHCASVQLQAIRSSSTRNSRKPTTQQQYSSSCYQHWILSLEGVNHTCKKASNQKASLKKRRCLSAESVERP